MTTFNYARARATAERQFARFGQAAVVRRVASTSDPSGTPWDPEDDVRVTTDHACVVAVMDYDNREIDGTLILAGDRRVYVSTAGLAIEPLTSDRLVIGGKSHEIVAVGQLNPAGTVVYYELQARA